MSVFFLLGVSVWGRRLGAGSRGGGLDYLPMLRIGTLVGSDIRAPCELARYLVPRTKYKRLAQTAQGLHPGYQNRLRQAV